MTGQAMHPVVAQLVASVQLVDGHAVLAKEACDKAHSALEALEPDVRNQVGLELVAVALRFDAQAGDDAEQAVQQLLALAAEHLPAKTMEALAETLPTMRRRDMAAVGTEAPSLTPVGATKGAGQSPMSIRLGRTTSRPR